MSLEGLVSLACLQQFPQWCSCLLLFSTGLTALWMLLNVHTGVRISSKKWQITCTGLFYFWGYCFIASNVLIWHLISSTEHRREKTFAQFLIFGCDITPCSFWAGLVWNIKARKTDPSHLERNAVTYGQRNAKMLTLQSTSRKLATGFDGRWWII